MVFDPTNASDINTRAARCNQEFDQIVICGEQTARIVRAPRGRLILTLDDSRSSHTRTDFILSGQIVSHNFPTPESLWEASIIHDGDFSMALG
jgi:hypothetical protein